jgi:hypothetical protein
MLFVWRYLSSSLTREQRGRTPYLVTVGGHCTIGMSRDMLLWIVNQNLVEVASPSSPTPETSLPLEPVATSGSGGSLLALAAIAVAGYLAFR